MLLFTSLNNFNYRKVLVIFKVHKSFLNFLSTVVEVHKAFHNFLSTVVEVLKLVRNFLSTVVVSLGGRVHEYVAVFAREAGDAETSLEDVQAPVAALSVPH